MYSAFNTLQLELERLLLLRDSITNSGIAHTHQDKLADLNNKIYSHEKAISLINRQHQIEVRIQARINRILQH